MWVIECTALQDLVDFHSGILLHILQSPPLSLLLFFHSTTGPLRKHLSLIASHCMCQCRPCCTSTRARKLFDEGEFHDYSTISSLRAQNGALTRSDPLSHHLQLLEELTDEAKSSRVGRSSPVSASSPRHKLPSCCSAAGHVHWTIHICQPQRISIHETRFILALAPVRSFAS